MSASGGCLLPGGVCSGGVCYGGCLLLGGGGIPACTEADTPPVDRITDTSKNITLATTSLRPVINKFSESFGQFYFCFWFHFEQINVKEVCLQVHHVLFMCMTCQYLNGNTCVHRCLFIDFNICTDISS